jgi:hypothetical protein
MGRFGGLTLWTLVVGIAALMPGLRHVTAQQAVTCNTLTPTIVVTEPGAINGTDGDDVIVGTAGNDIIYGGSGNDTICGEGGDDRIYGGSGDDQLWGEAFGEDGLIGIPGNDFISGESGDDLLVDPDGVLQILDGGSGTDRLIGVGILNGGSGADSFQASGGHSTINPGSGDIGIEEADGKAPDSVIDLPLEVPFETSTRYAVGEEYATLTSESGADPAGGNDGGAGCASIAARRLWEPSTPEPGPTSTGYEDPSECIGIDDNLRCHQSLGYY